jgi:phage terminase Nu1 subunit (DNA packaging protein)
MQSKVIRLNNIFRELWEQHVMWTRSFIISAAENLGDLDFVTERLLRNPSDFANVFCKFYGEKKADKLKELLTDHLLIAADLVNAAKRGDSARASELEKKWYENADDIAAFLNAINPYWSTKQWQKLLYEHLRMTQEEALLRLNGRYAEDIRMYDLIEEEALKMADYMTWGIIRQFGR